MGRLSKDSKLDLSESRECNLEYFYSEKLSLEEKISKVLLHLNSIDGIPHIEGVLNNLKLQKSDVMSVYDLLSSEICVNVNAEIEAMFELQLKSMSTEKKMDHLLYYLKTSRVSIPASELESMPNSREYRQFLALYTENTNYLKEVLQHKSKLSLLLDSQRILDRKFAQKMAKIDYQIISLGRVLKNLGESEKEEVCSLYNLKFDRVETLIGSITASEEKLKKLKTERSMREGGLIYSSFKEDILAQFRDS